MGSFANSIFNLLLGWVRTAAQSLWALISGEGGNIIVWMGENWLLLTIFICVACTLVDVLIHLIRWQPYKVWGSFIRRITGQERRQRKRMRREQIPQRSQAEEQPAVQEWVYPEAAPAVEEAALQPAMQQNMTEEEQEAYRSRFARPESQPITYRRPPEMDKLQYQAIRHEEPPAPQGLADYPPPAAEPVVEELPAAVQPELSVMQQVEQPRESLSNQMRRRMSQLQKNLGITEDELELTYRPAQPIVDEKEMYHAPVYPPNWQEQQTTQAVPRRRRQHRDISGNA